MTTQIGHFVPPPLPVRDVRELERFYGGVLGCAIAWIYEEECGSVCDGHRFRIVTAKALWFRRKIGR